MSLSINELKRMNVITRQHIADLLSSIGKPGEKQDEKTKTVQELNRQNRQGHDISLTLNSYQEF